MAHPHFFPKYLFSLALVFLTVNAYIYGNVRKAFYKRADYL